VLIAAAPLPAALPSSVDGGGPGAGNPPAHPGKRFPPAALASPRSVATLCLMHLPTPDDPTDFQAQRARDRQRLLAALKASAFSRSEEHTSELQSREKL